MLRGEFVDAVFDISESTTLTAEVDLGGIYDKLIVVIPTITNAQISVQVAEGKGETFQDLYITNVDGTSEQVITDASTGGITVTMPLGGFQFIKLKSSAAQLTTDKTCRVAGA